MYGGRSQAGIIDTFPPPAAAAAAAATAATAAGPLLPSYGM